MAKSRQKKPTKIQDLVMGDSKGPAGPKPAEHPGLLGRGKPVRCLETTTGQRQRVLLHKELILGNCLQIWIYSRHHTSPAKGSYSAFTQSSRLH